MKNLFKMHENDIQNIIENASKKILKEEFGIMEAKEKPVVKLTENDVKKLSERSFNKLMEQHFI